MNLGGNRQWSRGLKPLARQPNGHAGALSHAAFDRNMAAMALRQPFHDGKPQASALRHVQNVVLRKFERLEYLRKVFLSDAYAFVADAQRKFS